MRKIEKGFFRRGIWLQVLIILILTVVIFFAVYH